MPFGVNKDNGANDKNILWPDTIMTLRLMYMLGGTRGVYDKPIHRALITLQRSKSVYLAPVRLVYIGSFFIVCVYYDV